ncbi:MAG: molybdopterin-dependent oxidoreductase [Ketobacter sp.]|nr:molybdopterin-dependent oxidoreductase [Ketobacter sp.]
MSKPKEIKAADLSRREFLALAGMGIMVAGTAGAVVYPLATDMLDTSQNFPPDGEESWVATVCQLCPAGCSIMARRIGDRVVKVEGNSQYRLNHGKICPKAHANTEVLYDPDRLQGPKKRVGEPGTQQWEDISWDEAIALLTEKLGDLQANSEAHSLLFLKGNAPGQMSGLIDQFAQAFGTPNVVDAGTRCGNAAKLANQLNMGWDAGAAYDWEKVGQAIIFGGSLLEDWQPQMQTLGAYSFIRRGRYERGRIVQVSPYYSVTSAKADEWMPIKPGTEGALALGLTHVIIKEQQIDLAFINDYTTGYEAFKEMVLAEYAPEAVSGFTGLPAELIKRLARELAGNRPSIAAAGQGLGIGTNALFAHTAINALNAVLGSIDTEGGVLMQRHPPFTKWPKVAKVDQPRFDGAGTEEYPLAECVAGQLPDRIISGNPYSIKALFIYDSNPVYTDMGANRWKEVMDKIPFIVSFSPFLDESAGYADLILPDHTYLERMIDVVPPPGMGQAMVAIGQAVIPPLYNTRHTGDVLLEVAQKLGGPMAQALPAESYEDVLKYRYQGIFKSGEGSIQTDSFDDFWATLLDRGVWEGSRYQYEQWEDTLATPSGTFEFNMSQLADQLNTVLGAEAEESGILTAKSADLLASLGVSAEKEMALLPHYEPPAIAGDANEYPLHLIPYIMLPDAGNRAPNSTRLWNIYGMLAREAWGNWAGIHPDTAHEFGIKDKDMIWVETPQGKIQIKARLFEAAMPNTVAIPLGGGHTAGGRWASQIRGANPAEVVVPQNDPLAGTDAWLGTRAKISKASSEV